MNSIFTPTKKRGIYKPIERYNIIWGTKTFVLMFTLDNLEMLLQKR